MVALPLLLIDTHCNALREVASFRLRCHRIGPHILSLLQLLLHVCSYGSLGGDVDALNNIHGEGALINAMILELVPLAYHLGQGKFGRALAPTVRCG